MIGTDKEMLGEEEQLRVSTKGRPKVNRELAKRLIQAKYSTSQIAKALKCSAKTVRRIKAELIESGELTDLDAEPTLDVVEADFDAECERATGISYYQWLKNRTTTYSTIFNFCRRVWSEIWGRPSLVMAKDDNLQLGDTLCVKFLEVFGEDIKRIRRRKKHIRNIFRFLGRHDLCDRHLTMTQSRDPRPVRRIPEISMIDFPAKLVRCLSEMRARMGDEVETGVMFKLVSQVRTGAGNRGLRGLTVGSGSPSYIIMSSPDEYRCHVLEKLREEWDITWIPKEVRDKLYRIYEQRSEGQRLFQFKLSDVLKEWRNITEQIIGVGMTLHDLRKVSITWLYICGVPLEIATLLNVGWKDLNTPRDHYIELRKLLKKSDRLRYREQIPKWFKEGLDEYIEDVRS